MGIFSFFRNKAPFFSVDEQARLVKTIREAERETSGEIRLFVESKDPFVDPLDRAAQIFYKLQMQNTEHRNAVLVYVAMDHHEVALFGDEGIYNALGQEYWYAEIRRIISEIKENHLVDGLAHCIESIGQALKEKFPYEAGTDKNELPDDIVFGQ